MATVKGCTSPAAKNYDPAATEDDGSCVWLNSVGGQCYEFRDVPDDNVVDHSFTISMAVNPETLEPAGWVFFHDFFPDFYVHTRDLLFNLKNSIPFHQSSGPKGIYHFNTTPKPFFIDVLFAGKESMTLNSVRWITEVRAAGNDSTDDNKRASYLDTLTHITIWNQYQTSGRIALDKNKKGLSFSNNRNSEEEWSFDAFRDILDQVTDQFFESIFKDYAMIPDKLNPDLSWWNKRLIEGKYFIVRFEFDNIGNKQITLQDMDVDVSKSFR